MKVGKFFLSSFIVMIFFLILLQNYPTKIDSIEVLVWDGAEVHIVSIIIISFLAGFAVNNLFSQAKNKRSQKLWKH